MSRNADFFIDDAEKTTMSGWSFASIRDRFVDGPLPWSYLSTILPRIARASTMLDLDTGGGEFLADLPVHAQNTVATEGYAPNIEIASKRLKPLNIDVVPIDRETNHLPFGNDTFDLVLARHAGFDWQEVHRVLQPGGTFVSQQVGSENHRDLSALLGAKQSESGTAWNLQEARTQAKSARFELLLEQEAFPKDTIFDVGALIFQLKAVSWQIPDFSVEKYRDQLVKIQDYIDTHGCVEVTSHRFIFTARAL